MINTRPLARPTADTRRNGALDQQPPHSAEMEKGVLSSMMAGGPATIAECVENITADHFFVPAHRTFFNVLVEMWRADQPIDLISFTEELRSRNLLDSVGGAGAVTDLQSLMAEVNGFVPTAANVGYYLDICREKYVRRKIIATANESVRRAYEQQTDVAETLSFAKESLEALPEPRHGHLPPIEDAAELISKPIDLPPDVIEGMLSEGGKMVLGGGSKSFKTWQLVDLATAVASGTEFLGFATNKGRVLYLNLELQCGYFSWRTKTVIAKKSVLHEHLSFDVWNLRGYAAELYKLLPEILRQAGRGKYALIIIDPIYKVLGEREENVTHHVGAIMNDLERIAVHSGAAVAFGAHFSKGNQAGKESIDRIGGSGAFGRDPDSILIFTKHEEQDAFTVEATLRNHPPIDPFVVRWQFPLMQRDDMLDPTRLKQAGGAPRKATYDQLVDLLSDKPLRAGEWQKRAEEELGLKRSTFFDMKSELQRKHRIESIAGLFSQK
jgi:hypothetical protein